MAGDITKVNGVALSDYGASLLSYNTGAVALKNNYFKPNKRLAPAIFSPDMPLRSVSIKCEFYAGSDGLAESAATNFGFLLTAETDLYLPDGFYYRGVLTNAGKPTRIAQGIFQREYTLTAYRHGGLESITISASGKATIKGNMDAEVRYTITIGGGTTFTVNGITVQNITGSTIVIDGIKGLVTEDGANCFDKTDMTEFPTLKAGANDITIAGNGRVVIEYYPIYF